MNLLAAMSRGGLQFMLIIWLQGIWLPLHGYNYADTPLWAGIYMLPLTIGFLIAGPASGAVSDRFGARAFATGGLLLTAATFVGLILMPADFNYVLFAALLALNGIGMGLMAAPNSAAIMNAVPAVAARRCLGHPGHRHERRHGAVDGRVLHADGDRAGRRLPASLYSGLTGAGVTPDAAHTISHVPPVGTLFAAFLGDNPIKAAHAAGRPVAVAARVRTWTSRRSPGKTFFPHLISDPFMHGLLIAFSASIVMLLIAAGASLMRGERFVHADAHDEPHRETVGEATGPRRRRALDARRRPAKRPRTTTRCPVRTR